MNNKDDDRLRKTTIAFLKEFADKGYENAVECIDWLERQSKQKPVETVASKFKVGNWYQCTKDFFGKGVTFDKNTAYYCAQEGCLQDEYGCHIAIVKDLYDNFKLWTIQDAKDGDVLACSAQCHGEKIEQVGIYKEYIGRHGGCSNSFKFYAGIDWDHHLLIDKTMGSSEIFPATKEQRDLLFKKMKEAGYEWDAEKKTLRKIVHEPVENVTPKFRVWDWIVSNVSHEDYRICKILYIENDKYVIESVYGYQGYNIFETFDKDYHLWTIQDAKDGDVLVCNEEILLFKSYSVQGRISLYCWHNEQTNNFYSKEVTDVLLTIRNKIYPATKEQRELLFLKMHEAGYEWDAENKQLKKIKK